MFTEKELYFYKNDTKSIESEKAIIVPEMKSGVYIDDELDDFESVNNAFSKYLFVNKIYHKNTVRVKSNNAKSNYYFEDLKECEKLSESKLLDFFESPSVFTMTLKKYITKTDNILKKIMNHIHTCKDLEKYFIDTMGSLYLSDKDLFIGYSDFVCGSIEAVEFISSKCLKGFTKINSELEFIKNNILYGNSIDLVKIMDCIISCIIQFDDLCHPFVYAENEKFDYFYIEKDDITIYLEKVKKRINDRLNF